MVAVICSMLVLSAAPGNLYTVFAEQIEGNAIYVAPGATGSGAEHSPRDLEKAIDVVAAGQTIYLLEGVYEYSDTILIAESNSGTKEQYKTLRAYPGAEVVLDFSGQALGKRGIILEGSYWHFYGITICNAGDNGMLLAGDYNRIELCVFDGNRDTGLQLSRNNGKYNKVEQWPSYNYILNCTSRNNSDPTGENADGFAPKLTCGEGNVFDGCLAYNNVDDGWDCYAKSATGPIGVVTIINSIAFRNGQTEEGVFTPESDGNGFKLGGGGIGTPHVVINCLAFENKNCGFTDNNNPSALSMINCTAFNNNGAGKKADFNVYRCKNANAVNILAYNATKNKNKFQNMSAEFVIYPADKDWYRVETYGPFDTTDSSKKGTKTDTGLTAADFLVTQAPELGTDFHVFWREADGSLDTLGYAMLSANSAYADFASDGGACGARIAAGAEFVTPDNAMFIKSMAIEGSAAVPAVPESAVTMVPTATPEPTVTVAPTANLEPVATEVPTSVAEPTLVEEPVSEADSETQFPVWGIVAGGIIVVVGIAIVLILKKDKKPLV